MVGGNEGDEFDYLFVLEMGEGVDERRGGVDVFEGGEGAGGRGWGVFLEVDDVAFDGFEVGYYFCLPIFVLLR